MLEYLRNAADKPVAKILMGILIFSFVGWGVADWVFGLGSSDKTLMRVGGDKISVAQYDNVKRSEIRNLSREEQRDITIKPAAMVAFKDKTIQKIANQHRKIKQAQDLEYTVSDKRIIADIHDNSQFQKDGAFSQETFDAILRNSGLSIDDVANDVRLRLLDEMVMIPISTPMKTPDFAVTATYNARNKMRNIDLATVKFSDFSVGKPTDEQLREFYNQNPHKVPETRTISYALVAADTSKPDESEAADEVAKKLEEDLFGGESLEIAAKNHNAKFVSFDNVSADNLPDDKVINDDEVLARIFDMDEDMTSEKFESEGNGFVIVRVDKVTPEHDADFESVKKSLVSEWVRAEQKKQAYVRANEILTELNQTGKIQKKRNMDVSRANGADLPVLVATFKNPVGDNSIVDGENEFYVLHIASEVTPKVDTKKFESVKTDVENMSGKHIESDYDLYLERIYPIKMNESAYEKL